MSSFTLIVKPVGDSCLFSCSYCYNSDPSLSDRIPSGKMSLGTLDILLSKYLKHPQKYYTVLWHGGEPLLAGLDFYEEALRLQRFYRKAYSVEAPVRNRLQTNAALVNERWATFFKENKFRLGISLDGPAIVHDAHRRFKDGKGTHSAVMAGIKTLLDAGNTFGIGAVITRTSLVNPTQLFNFFKERFSIFDFSPCFLSPTEEDPEGALGVSPLEYAEFAINLFDYWWEIDDPSIRIRSFRHYVQVGLGETPRICSMASGCSRYMAVDWDGKVYPCGRNASVESLYLGSILEKDFETVRTDDPYRAYLNVALSLSEDCKKCSWLFACNNGCPASRYIGHGRFVAKTPLCEARKIIFANVSEKVALLQQAL